MMHVGRDCLFFAGSDIRSRFLSGIGKYIPGIGKICHYSNVNVVIRFYITSY